MKGKTKYIPALKLKVLTRFFDPLMGITGLEQKFSLALLYQANIKGGDIVLDFGCGTGTLTIMMKGLVPTATIHGLDIDSQILNIARNKSKKQGSKIFYQEYDGTTLPYQRETFDKVTSSLVFHHLIRSEKIAALKDIHRVLKYGGELHVLDFGQARNILMRVLFLPIQVFDGFANTTDNVRGLLPDIIAKAGFNEVEERNYMTTVVGNISLYKALK